MLIVDHNLISSIMHTQRNNFGAFTSFCLITDEPGYNDMCLYGTSSITSDVLWYQLIR